MSQVVSSAFFGLQTAALIEYIDKLTKEEELYIYNKTQMLYIISQIKQDAIQRYLQELQNHCIRRRQCQNNYEQYKEELVKFSNSWFEVLSDQIEKTCQRLQIPGQNFKKSLENLNDDETVMSQFIQIAQIQIEEIYPLLNVTSQPQVYKQCYIDKLNKLLQKQKSINSEIDRIITICQIDDEIFRERGLDYFQIQAGIQRYKDQWSDIEFLEMTIKHAKENILIS